MASALPIDSQTHHFKLGLYALIQKDFGGALFWGGVSFAVSALVHSLRVLRSALGNAGVENVLRFHVSTWGNVYSTFFVVHILLVGIFYIKALMAMRRLANSEYYQHPGASRSSRVYHDMLPRGEMFNVEQALNEM